MQSCMDLNQSLSDSYVEVGAEGSDRASLMAQGVTASMYEE